MYKHKSRHNTNDDFREDVPVPRFHHDNRYAMIPKAQHCGVVKIEALQLP